MAYARNWQPRLSKLDSGQLHRDCPEVLAQKYSFPITREHARHDLDRDGVVPQDELEVFWSIRANDALDGNGFRSTSDWKER